MKKISTHALLDALEQQTESHLFEAIHSFQNLNEKKLLQPAINGGWSIAQCLEHLNRYGNYYLPEIKKGLEKDGSYNDEFKSTWLGNYFIKMMNADSGKKKIKAFKEYSPAPNLDAPAVVAEFIQQQETLLRYLRSARNKDLNKIKIAISITRWIKLRLGDTLQFLIAHNERHIRQAKRNLAQANVTSTQSRMAILACI
ncbi:MAG TPA: DinB family protein [Cyclobacteriaceae bacterium]|jgi:uncharacterized damage-inducible protein DinB|nr:DinB family protein [Cyclobacteriaceae bacterium]